MKIILALIIVHHLKKLRDFFAARPLKLTQSKVNSLVLGYIMDAMRPLYTVERPSFKNLISGLAPYAKVPGRKALAVQIEAKFVEVPKDMVRDFELTDYISLTTDIWSANKKSYLGMTAHLLNEDLEWKSYALACSGFKGSHT